MRDKTMRWEQCILVQCWLGSARSWSGGLSLQMLAF